MMRYLKDLEHMAERGENRWGELATDLAPQHNSLVYRLDSYMNI